MTGAHPSVQTNQQFCLLLLSWSIFSIFSPAFAAEKATLPRTALAPEKFSMPGKLGYAAAKQYPEVIEHLFCYCGCDITDQHKSLMDCYVSNHGAYCTICMEEAILAKEMKDKNSNLKEIQAKVDKKFGKLYPYGSATQALLDYRKELVKLGIEPTQAADGAAKRIIVKPKCCAGDNHKSNGGK